MGKTREIVVAGSLSGVGYPCVVSADFFRFRALSEKFVHKTSWEHNSNRAPRVAWWGGPRCKGYYELGWIGNINTIINRMDDICSLSSVRHSMFSQQPAASSQQLTSDRTFSIPTRPKDAVKSCISC